jgi:CPA2 family monovalent cation:H+ antiporter-2
MHGAPEFLQSLAIVFCVAGLTTVVFQKLRQPVVFGYLIAGMIVGPHIPIPLVAESGVETQVVRLVKPLCDAFAAVFFVSVGMLIDPFLIGRHWIPVVVFLFLVVAGKVVGVTFGTFLAGYGVRTSVQAGMSLAQIGEFSFIIAALGLSTGATRDFLYPAAVTVSAATTLLTPWMIRWSAPVATRIDRRLPKPLRMFAALYGSWLEKMRQRGEPERDIHGRRRRFRMMLIDLALVLGILTGASLWRSEAVEWIGSWTGISVATARYAFLAAVVLLSGVFCFGIVRGVHRLVISLVDKAMPPAEPGKLDLAAAPRRALLVTLQIVIVLLVGMPLLAIFQPFLPRLSGPAILLGVLILLGILFWRGAANLEGHVKAVSQVIVDHLRKQAETEGADEDADALRKIQKLLPGLGHIDRLRLRSDSFSVGRTLAELNVGSLSGATILVILRGGEKAVIPSGKDILKAGDVLALAGTPDSVEAARKILTLGTENSR